MYEITGGTTTSYDKHIETLGGALDSNSVLSESDAKAGQSIAKAVSNAFQQNSRRKTLHKMIEEGNKPLTQILDAIISILDKNLKDLHGDEIAEIDQLQIDYLAFSKKHAWLAPLYKKIIIDHRREVFKAQENSQGYRDAIIAIRNKHQELYKSRASLLKVKKP